MEQHTGSIATALPNRQYQVIVDGSKRTTLRYRRFLKRILPACLDILPACLDILPACLDILPACLDIETVADFPTTLPLTD